VARNGLTGRVERLERRRPGSPVFAIHGAAGPDGRCPDCDLGADVHFTITIDRDGGGLERQYIGIDLAAA
jgi:hypothetical protein